MTLHYRHFGFDLSLAKKAIYLSYLQLPNVKMALQVDIINDWTHFNGILWKGGPGWEQATTFGILFSLEDL